MADRIQCTDWIHIAIRNRLRDEQEWGCSLAQAQQGYAMRLFAFCGGPLVFDALTDAMALSRTPERTEDVLGWFEEVVDRIVKTKAAAAAATIGF